MKTIRFTFGMDIKDAASLLVKHAPAKGKFNDIIITAKGPSVTVQNVVDQYMADFNAAQEAYAQSPDGQERAAQLQFDKDIVRKTIPRLLTEGFDPANSQSMMQWCYDLLYAGSLIGFTAAEEASICAVLSSRGITPSIHVRDPRCKTDPDIHAKWLAGQVHSVVLNGGYGGETFLGFASDWLKKHSTSEG